ESGYGREGGREGLREYLEPTWFKKAPALKAAAAAKPSKKNLNTEIETPSIDQTIKLYIGGKQARPDSGYSLPIHAKDGKLLGEAPLGNRKDIRNAVEAARKASGWAKTTAHNRAQVLYYYGENLSLRSGEIKARLARVVGEKQAAKEVETSIERVFSYAAWADKFDGAVHNPPMRNVSIAMNEAIGTVAIACPTEMPLLGFISTVMPAIAMGNTVVAIPSEVYPLIVADLYQVFETSDLPGGVVNIVTGRTAELTKTLAEHDDVDAVWCFGDRAAASAVKSFSIGNLKQVFTTEGRSIDWFDVKQGEGRWFLEHAVQVKNIWVPYGE
ncbi:MAG TPA: aldehyde dehydrogenase family protein, partial [Terriglobales bacterium]|nr:aldehyde dehydrogenase family protein [Terriglobales bacterium]